MSLNSILGTAGSGIAASSNAMAVISHNVANARTAHYTRETANQSSIGDGFGVRIEPTRRDLDATLQAATFAQDATVAGLTTRQKALAGIDALQGATGSDSDLSSLLAQLQSGFTALATDPSNQTQQQAVVQAADTLAQQVRRVAGAVDTARQTAQDDAVAAVGELNSALSRVGGLSEKINRARGAGQSTADLESQRDDAIATVNAIVPVAVRPLASGDIALIGGGLILPTTSDAAFSLAPARLGTGASAAPSPPALLLDGEDVTARVTGGRLGAHLALRDTSMPEYAAGLDEFAHTLASRFDAQGLTLFTAADGTLPAGGGQPVQSGYLGLAAGLRVNPVATSTPSVVRDGLQGATPTTPSGRAGDSSLITRVLTYTFGAEESAGVAQPPPSTTGLGAAGRIALPYAAPATLAGFSTALVAAMSGDAGDASNQLDSATALRTTLQGQLSAASGVSIDEEMANMVQIQNAYAANGKVIAAVQAMWNSLLAMVP